MDKSLEKFSMIIIRWFTWQATSLPHLKELRCRLGNLLAEFRVKATRKTKADLAAVIVERTAMFHVHPDNSPNATSLFYDVTHTISGIVQQRKCFLPRSNGAYNRLLGKTE